MVIPALPGKWTSSDVARKRWFRLLASWEHDIPLAVVFVVPNLVSGLAKLKFDPKSGASTPTRLQTARPRRLRFTIRLSKMRGPTPTLIGPLHSERSRLTRCTPLSKPLPDSPLNLRASVRNVRIVRNNINNVFTTSIVKFSCTDRSVDPTFGFLAYS